MENQFKKVVGHYDTFLHAPSMWTNGFICDLYDGSCFKEKYDACSKSIYPMGNCDGVTPAFKSKSFNLWPFTFCIANLERFERQKYENIVLCTLYYGKKKPDFTFFMDLVKKNVEEFKIYVGDHLFSLKLINL